MLLKILIIAIVLYFLYRAFGGSFKLAGKKEQSSEKEENTLIECCKCGVYATKKEMTKKGDCYYCQDCI